MRTVAWLKAELAKFPDDAVCFACESDITGIVIERENEIFLQGIIYCSSDDDYNHRHETKLLPPAVYK